MSVPTSQPKDETGRGLLSRELLECRRLCLKDRLRTSRFLSPLPARCGSLNNPPDERSISDLTAATSSSATSGRGGTFDSRPVSIFSRIFIIIAKRKKERERKSSK